MNTRDSIRELMKYKVLPNCERRAKLSWIFFSEIIYMYIYIYYIYIIYIYIYIYIYHIYTFLTFDSSGCGWLWDLVAGSCHPLHCFRLCPRQPTRYYTLGIGMVLNMMTSSNGNIFCVTGPLYGEGIHRSPVNTPHRGHAVTRSFDIFFDLRPNKR